MKPDAAHGAGQVPRPAKKSLLVCSRCAASTPGAGARGDWTGWQTVGLWPWAFPEGVRRAWHPEHQAVPTLLMACGLDTHVLEGQEDGEEESTEEEGHEQHK